MTDYTHELHIQGMSPDDGVLWTNQTVEETSTFVGDILYLWDDGKWRDTGSSSNSIRLIGISQTLASGGAPVTADIKVCPVAIIPSVSKDTIFDDVYRRELHYGDLSFRIPKVNSEEMTYNSVIYVDGISGSPTFGQACTPSYPGARNSATQYRVASPAVSGDNFVDIFISSGSLKSGYGYQPGVGGVFSEFDVSPALEYEYVQFDPSERTINTEVVSRKADGSLTTEYGVGKGLVKIGLALACNNTTKDGLLVRPDSLLVSYEDYTFLLKSGAYSTIVWRGVYDTHYIDQKDSGATNTASPLDRLIAKIAEYEIYSHSFPGNIRSWTGRQKATPIARKITSADITDYALDYDFWIVWEEGFFTANDYNAAVIWDYSQHHPNLIKSGNRDYKDYSLSMNGNGSVAGLPDCRTISTSGGNWYQEQAFNATSSFGVVSTRIGYPKARVAHRTFFNTSGGGTRTSAIKLQCQWDGSDIGSSYTVNVSRSYNWSIYTVWVFDEDVTTWLESQVEPYYSAAGLRVVVTFEREQWNGTSGVWQSTSSTTETIYFNYVTQSTCLWLSHGRPMAWTVPSRYLLRMQDSGAPTIQTDALEGAWYDIPSPDSSIDVSPVSTHVSIDTINSDHVKLKLYMTGDPIAGPDVVQNNYSFPRQVRRYAIVCVDGGEAEIIDLETLGIEETKSGAPVFYDPGRRYFSRPFLNNNWWNSISNNAGSPTKWDFNRSNKDYDVEVTFFALYLYYDKTGPLVKRHRFPTQTITIPAL